MAGNALLTVKGVTAGYGKVTVLQDVSLVLNEREIVTIIGPNGAGKSTVLKTVMGFLTPQEGRIHFSGSEITGLEPHKIVARGIGYVPQGRVTFPQMSVHENLQMGGFLQRDAGKLIATFERVYHLFPRLAERRTQLCGTLSGGEQQMVALGRAMMNEPKCVVMDEPSLGLSPKFVDLVFAKFQAMRDLGMALLIVEQNAARALAASDRGYVLELGRNRAHGRGTELLENQEIKMLFIGG